MNFRITSNGMFRSYRNNLYKNRFNLNKSMESVQTQRNFNTFAEDPASASRAFQLRRSMWRTEDQIDNSNYLIGKFEMAFQALEPVVDSSGEGADLSGIKASLEAITDTAGSTRVIVGENLQMVAQSIAQTMNVKNGDEYVFAGADALDLPFQWNSETGVLTYQGVDVNQAADRMQQPTYMDIGLGMETDDDGNLIPSSTFDGSLSGLDFLNYGMDEEGDPKNLVVLMNRLGTLFTNCDEKTGQFPSIAEREEAKRLMDKVKNAISYTQEKHMEISSQAIYLSTNKDLLTHEHDNLNEEILNTEQRDGADAIMEMVYAQYSYNAALRIGNGILSQSLLDYMR